MTCSVCKTDKSTPCGGCGNVEYCGKVRDINSLWGMWKCGILWQGKSHQLLVGGLEMWNIVAR